MDRDLEAEFKMELKSGMIPESVRASTKPTVSCGVRLISIRNIDHVQGQFSAKFAFYLNWTDPNNVGKAVGTYLDQTGGQTTLASKIFNCLIIQRKMRKDLKEVGSLQLALKMPKAS